MPHKKCTNARNGADCRCNIMHHGNNNSRIIRLSVFHTPIQPQFQMMTNYEISGEAGKKLGPARQPLEALGIENPRVRLASLDEDELTFTQTFQSPQDAGVDGFDLGQRVELWRGGRRMFSGWFLHSEPDDSGEGFLVSRKVVGPWWWMRQTPLTGLVDGKERPSLVFPNGNLSGHLRKLLERAIDLGVPIRIGEIADSYDIPQRTFKQKSVADALGGLMSCLPDGVVEVDHSGAGYPAIHIRRRPGMETVAFRRGEAPLTGVSIRPRLDHRPTQVRITYASRDENGRTVISEQLAGHAGDAFPSRQIVAVSGDDLGQLVPDPDESAEVASSSVSAGLKDWVLDRSGVFDRARQHGLASTTPGFQIRYPYPLTLYYQTGFSSSLPATNKSYTIESAIFTGEDGSLVNASVLYFYLGDDPPDWLKRLLNLTKVKVSGQWAYEWRDSSTYSGNTTAYNIPDWMFHLESTEVESGFRGMPYNYDHLRLYIGQWSAEAWVTTELISPATTVYKPPDYDYILPPDDFASNLRKAQDWLPYQGRITLAGEDAGGTRFIGRAVNILDHMPEYRNMRALPQKVDLDLANGKTTITLGPPPRQSLNGMLNRVRQNQDDNIVYA